MKYQHIHGAKYRLFESEMFVTGIPGFEIAADFVELYADGLLLLKPGFCWDGASGLAIDRASNMRGALLHDALYYLIRRGDLPPNYRLSADELMRQAWREDGMWMWLADAEVWIVNRVGGLFARHNPDEGRVRTAP
jgi:hypothetical protein